MGIDKNTGSSADLTGTFIDIKQLSQLIHISVSSINRYVTEGKIPSYKVEKRRLFKRAEMLEWMEEHKDFQNL